METRYDVIIVGAGPAGGTAAYFLGQAGKRVLVLEKEILPRQKTCGGGVSASLLQDVFPFSFDSVIETEIQHVSYVFQNRIVTIPVKKHSVLTVMRDQFDALILSNAQADVRQGMAVHTIKEYPAGVAVETTTGETFTAQYVVGADGANSVVAQAVGLRRRKQMAVAIEADAPMPAEALQRLGNTLYFIFDDDQFGYAWVFPKKSGVSVGVGAFHPSRGALQNRLKQIAEMYSINLEGVPVKGHPVPIFIRYENIATDRVVLIGDAAGLVDPFIGDGIRLAIQSGQIAADAILADNLHQYTRQVFWRISLSHFVGLILSRLFYRFRYFFLRIIAPEPRATDTFVTLISGHLTYPRLVRRALSRMPLILRLLFRRDLPKL